MVGEFGASSCLCSLQVVAVAGEPLSATSDAREDFDAAIGCPPELKVSQIAVEGCCHGELDQIYATLKQTQAQAGIPIDLLLICGDFQAIRNQADLQCLAVPQKYRQLGGFHKYYSGQTKAPFLTIVIGGNHEASNYMTELFHGGWVAPSIYYLGGAGSVLVNGLRISGASGIFNHQHYNLGHFEKLPYDHSTMRSVYHTRRYDIFRLAQACQLSNHNVDLFLSHDWPLSIEQHGNLPQLLRAKPFFKDEVQQNKLGSPPLFALLQSLKPDYWFAAHLHVKYAALFKHDGTATTVKQRQRAPPVASAPNPDEIPLDEDAVDQPTDLEAVKRAALATLESHAVASGSAPNDPPIPAAPPNKDEITLDEDEGNPDEIALSDEEASKPVAQPRRESGKKATKFLALSKVLPGGVKHLQILDVHPPQPAATPKLTFDPVWLAITRAFAPQLSRSAQQAPLPTDATVIKGTIDRELEWVKTHLPAQGQVRIEEVQQFSKTAPAPDDPGGDSNAMPPAYSNPQTERFCEWLQIENKIRP